MNVMLSRIAEVLGGELHGEDVMVTGVSTDSRNICRQEMFVALRGDKYDAHDFIEHAVQRGAACALVDHACPVNLPLQAVMARPRSRKWWRPSCHNVARFWLRMAT